MSLTVIHPFGAYQPGDVIAPADEAAILASEAVQNVVASGASAPELAPAVDAAPVADPEPEIEAEPSYFDHVSDFHPS